MTDFRTRAIEATNSEKAQLLGVATIAVDRNGRELISYAAGRTNLDPSKSQPISTSSVIVVASCTKILVAIAILKLAEQGILTLDDPSIVATHLPELNDQPIITSNAGEPLTFEDRRNDITVRTLLNHTCGSGHDFADPKLLAWRKSRGEAPQFLEGGMPEAVNCPSLFQPGEGWLYGGGLDWAGLLIERLSGKTLGQHLRTEIFDVVGCDAKISFDMEEIEAAGGVIVQVVTRDKEGIIKDFDQVKKQKSHRGGGGLLTSAENFIKIIADIVAPTSKLLSQESLDLLFAPQFEEGSVPLEAFRKKAHVFTPMIGPVAKSLPLEAVNHGLGGLVITQDSKDMGRTKGTMGWGGAFGSSWLANRDKGVAAFYGDSIYPPFHAGSSKQLLDGFVAEAWKLASE